MSDDTNFDRHSQRFKKNIYNTDKGRLRLSLILNDLYENLTILNSTEPLSILDAGCGMGQVALSLAGKGHHLTLCDISSEMISIARSTFSDENRQAEFYHSSIQQLGSDHDMKYDVIIFHAVLEWLEKPEEIIVQLQNRLKPGGFISLMFYNLNSIVFYNALKGNFRKIMSQDFRGHPGGLTPVNPINPEDLDGWLDTSGIDVLHKAGIRIFYDYLKKELKQQRTFEDILELELMYSSIPPFNMMGRYIHYICQQK